MKSLHMNILESPCGFIILPLHSFYWFSPHLYLDTRKNVKMSKTYAFKDYTYILQGVRDKNYNNIYTGNRDKYIVPVNREQNECT